MGGWGCTAGRSPIGPRLHRRAPIGPDCAVGPPIAPSGPDQGEIALSLVGLLYKAASSATLPGRSARILGGCGAVGDIARAYYAIAPAGIFDATAGISPYRSLYMFLSSSWSTRDGAPDHGPSSEISGGIAQMLLSLLKFGVLSSEKPAQKARPA